MSQVSLHSGGQTGLQSVYSELFLSSSGKHYLGLGMQSSYCNFSWGLCYLFRTAQGLLDCVYSGWTFLVLDLSLKKIAENQVLLQPLIVETVANYQSELLTTPGPAQNNTGSCWQYVGTGKMFLLIT